MDLLALNNITKRYPGVTALDNVSISFRQGEVHALVGENGAGKSTFIKAISGAIRPDEGTIIFDGVTYDHLTPQKALELGISVVYQEMIQFEAMSIADNLFMSNGSDTDFFVNDAEHNRKTAELLEKFQCHVSPKTRIRELSMANRQIVEICKAILRNARVLILDEPTASITVEEQRRLFEVIRDLKKQGVTVIYISHRLEELFEICDRVSILRDGQYIDTLNIAQTDKQGLIKLMVGRELSENYPVKDNPAEKDVVLKVENLSGNGVRDISFELHKSEILGFAGLVGAGRTELMHLLYGAAGIEAGTVRINGETMSIHTSSDAMKAGIGLIPEDRKGQGCFLDKPIFWNISISNIKSLCSYGFIDRKKEMEQAENYGKLMRIKTPNLKVNVGALSGGNQQKVVIAKTLASLPDILIFDEPTRGIDIGARYEIYQLMIELTKQGKSILMVSSDMEELLGMSERIVVLHEGEQTGTIEKVDFSQERVLALASGYNG
ncbi:MAG: sugar ABC transporter ATP-binding protein [Oscillospiraceae bacterium]|nr:sugar ABC transporter ATP-binding protein [Oscillospiraceae bacterium]